MAPRFIVIQGGLPEQARPAELRSAQALDQVSGWQVDLSRLDVVDAEAVSGGPALLVRNAVRDLLPDNLPPVVQHRPAGHRIMPALAWDRDAEACRDAEAWREALQGLEPLAMPHAVGGGRAHRWQLAEPEPEPEAVGHAAQAAAEAVDRAVKARLRALRRPIRLVGAAEPVRLSSPKRPTPATKCSTRPRTVPTAAFIGIRPTGWEAPALKLNTVAEPAALGDAAEVPRPSVVSRLFGRRAALRLEFLRPANAKVAGILRLGTEAASLSGRRARV